MEAVNQEKLQIKSKGVWVKQIIHTLVTNFFEHEVDKNAAALAYYFMFALFPLLIFISNLLGILDLNITAITHVVQQVLPRDIVEVIESYLIYVSETSSHTLMWFALIFTVWFPMRAVNGLMNDVRLAYHLDKPKNPIKYTIRQLIYTIVLLIVIGLTLLLLTMGEHVLSYIVNLMPESILQGTSYLLGIWQYLRFFPVALLMLAALGTLYAASLDERQPMKAILPGIVAALVVWMLVSIGFSFYVENFAKYSVIYGTLGAVIILLMWLYFTAVILIMGAELNAAILHIEEK